MSDVVTNEDELFAMIGRLFVELKKRTENEAALTQQLAALTADKAAK